METYEPTNTLKLVASDLWVVDGPIERLAYFGTSVPFPTRMVVIRRRRIVPNALAEELRALALPIDKFDPSRAFRLCTEHASAASRIRKGRSADVLLPILPPHAPAGRPPLVRPAPGRRRGRSSETT